ncbi:hypothetical protein IAG25_34880 [Caballeronia sp. EK]|uniref:hypothetical protein n=1 Tax=Caballeronia sp. EK TaxID=2767469 RepID=UPI00165585A2|nr:hypothetical protein [Caballeronia sp. EK]MBC8642011.1 hypothetical protein [Caballeronia sp. EK]
MKEQCFEVINAISLSEFCGEIEAAQMLKSEMRFDCLVAGDQLDVFMSGGRAPTLAEEE